MKILNRKLATIAITLFVLPLLVNSYISWPLTSAATPIPPKYPNYNKDAYSDLAVGVIGENIGTIVDAGAVNVMFARARQLGQHGHVRRNATTRCYTVTNWKTTKIIHIFLARA